MSKESDILDLKVSKLQEEGQKLVSKLVELNEAIKKARLDKKNLIGQINQCNGAIQAYTDSSKLIKGADAGKQALKTEETA